MAILSGYNPSAAIRTGSYTPAIVGVVNATGIVVEKFYYSRTPRGLVTVYGTFRFTSASTVVVTTINIPPPFPKSFASQYDITGVANLRATCQADAGNAQYLFQAPLAGVIQMTVNFQYQL